MEIVQALKQLAKELSIRSVPKLLKSAQHEGVIGVTRKFAEDALKLSVPKQVIAPPPRSLGKVYSESPESRYSCDLIDFSQNSPQPDARYILVLMQTWSRKMWVKAIPDKTAEVCATALQDLLQKDDLSPSQPHDLIHDAGKEWSLLYTVLPQSMTERTKDPVDPNGIASLDKGIQTLKQTLEHIIEEEGGNWVRHLQQAVRAYNRTPNSAVLGPPATAENGDSRQFLIDQANADAFEHNQNLYDKRSAEVEGPKAYRTPTGNKRSFNPQYGSKQVLASIEPGRQYVVDDKDNYDLLTRLLPVHQESEEPRGRLTSERQYKKDTLRPLAEKIHAFLINKPTDLKLLADRYTSKLEDDRITFSAFLKLYPELFEVKDGVVYARTVSQTIKRRSAKPKEDKPEPHQDVIKQIEDLRPSSRLFSEAQRRRSDAVSAHIMSYIPKTTAEQKAQAAEAKRKKAADAQAKKEEKLSAAVQRELEKQRKQLARLKPPK